MPPDPRAAYKHRPEPVTPSVLFWLCLFTGATLFAAVFLAPKAVIGHRLQEQEFQFRQHLASLEHQNRFLQRVADALENDPEFTAEVARFDFDAAAPDEQQLPVAPVRPRARNDQAATAATPSVPAWLPWAERLALDRRLSDLCLLTAAGLVIAAFAFFHPISPSRRLRRQSLGHS